MSHYSISHNLQRIVFYVSFSLVLSEKASLQTSFQLHYAFVLLLVVYFISFCFSSFLERGNRLECCSLDILSNVSILIFLILQCPSSMSHIKHMFSSLLSSLITINSCSPLNSSKYSRNYCRWCAWNTFEGEILTTATGI